MCRVLTCASHLFNLCFKVGDSLSKQIQPLSQSVAGRQFFILFFEQVRTVARYPNSWLAFC
jgi:hypothetical protein